MREVIRVIVVDLSPRIRRMIVIVCLSLYISDEITSSSCDVSSSEGHHQQLSSHIPFFLPTFDWSKLLSVIILSLRQ